MGGGSSTPKRPPEPAPTPQPVMGREENAARKKVKTKRGGRSSTILAGRLNSTRNTNVLNTKLG